MATRNLVYYYQNCKGFVPMVENSAKILQILPQTFLIKIQLSKVAKRKISKKEQYLHSTVHNSQVLETTKLYQSMNGKRKRVYIKKNILS